MRYRYKVVAFAVVIVVAMLWAVMAYADCQIGESPCDLWPDPPAYETTLLRAPSNWVTVGHYTPGDVVWRRTQIVGYSQVTDRWSVYEYDDSDRLSAPSCCSDGPYYVSSSGTLFVP